MGVLADIQAISADSAKLATDTAALATLQAQVTAAQDALANDAASSQHADATLAADLQASGPIFVLQADGTALVYEVSATPPGYLIKVAKSAT